MKAWVIRLVRSVIFSMETLRTLYSDLDFEISVRAFLCDTVTLLRVRYSSDNVCVL